MAIGFEYNGIFMENYAKAKDFYEEHGYFPTRKENKRLNSWAMKWWRDTYLKNPELHQEKAGMLTAIGFKYQSKDDRYDEMWMLNYKECKAFFNEHGHFPTQKENKSLNGWARDWWTRVYLKNPEKHQEKADMLTAIGFEYKGKKQ